MVDAAPRGEPNALTIRTPVSPMTICARVPVAGGYVNQSVPIGYVVASVTYASECPFNNGAPNAQVIQKV